MLEARFVQGVADVAREEWDRLEHGGSPFHDWTFLAAMEEDSAVPHENVLPSHLTLREGGRLVAACPLYVKGDGRAEFIYDWTWSMIAARHGLDYYPKAVAWCPLTPAVAPRFLVEPGRDPAPLKRALAETVEAWAREVGLTGVHWLFVDEDDAALLESLGYLRRESAQLALDCGRWSNVDDYLGSFRARHRKSLKRERRRMEELGLSVERVEGEAIGAEHRDAMFEFYSRTCREHGTGSDYVKRRSWDRLFADWRHRLLLCFARTAGGERVGGSLCVQGEDTLHGRYWGCRGDWPSLYFNLTCHAPLEFAIERRLSRFWAGFGNSAHKHARGFEPVRTLSLHRVFEPRLHAHLAAWLDRERALVGRDLEEARAHSRLVR